MFTFLMSLLLIIFSIEVGIWCWRFGTEKKELFDTIITFLFIVLGLQLIFWSTYYFCFFFVLGARF